MTFGRFSLAVSSALLLFASLVYADDGSLFVAGIQMRLGMPKEPLLARLRSEYRVSETSTDSYFIFEKRGDGYRPVGGIAFRDNRVSWLSRDWGAFRGQEAMAFATELHSSLQNLQDATGQPVAAYATKTQSTPGLRFTTIEFSSGARRLLLSIAEGDASRGGQQVSLQENVSAR